MQPVEQTHKPGFQRRRLYSILIHYSPDARLGTSPGYRTVVMRVSSSLQSKTLAEGDAQMQNFRWTGEFGDLKRTSITCFTFGIPCMEFNWLVRLQDDSTSKFHFVFMLVHFCSFLSYFENLVFLLIIRKNIDNILFSIILRNSDVKF